MKVELYYYSVIFNRETEIMEFFMPKESQIQDLLEHVENGDLFLNERLRDGEEFKENTDLCLFVIEKKNEKMVGRASKNMEIHEYLPKH